MYTYTHTHRQIDTHTNEYTHIHTHTHTNEYKHVYTHTHTQINTHNIICKNITIPHTQDNNYISKYKHSSLLIIMWEISTNIIVLS